MTFRRAVERQLIVNQFLKNKLPAYLHDYVLEKGWTNADISRIPAFLKEHNKLNKNLKSV